MNIGNPSRSLALAETGRKEYLSVEDKAWELGVSLQSSESAPQLISTHEVIASGPLLVSSSTNIAAAPFTRLCQASHLPSLVLTHVNDDIFESPARLEEARQLNSALLALCSSWKAKFLVKQQGSLSRWLYATGECSPRSILAAPDSHASALATLYHQCAKKLI
jgi:hypothetical protein